MSDRDSICRKCKGKGKIIKTSRNALPFSHPRFDPADIEYQKCPKCKGRIRKAKSQIKEDPDG